MGKETIPTRENSNFVEHIKLEKISLGRREEIDGSIWYKPAGYFVCPDDVKRVFGEKPVVLKIQFPTEDSRDWVRHYYRLYSVNGTPLCAGDGKEAIENLLPGIDGKPCHPAGCLNFRLGACRTVMCLYFLMLECSNSLYYLETMSPVSIRNITCFHRKLQEFRKLNRDFSLYLQVKKVNDACLTRPAYALELSISVNLKNVVNVPWVDPAATVVLPNPGQNPPDDFYPTYIDTGGKTTHQLNDEAMLLDQWSRLKNKIYHFEIQGQQISRWFLKHYHFDVDITEFDPPIPPGKITPEMLTNLLHSIECHTVS